MTEIIIGRPKDKQPHSRLEGQITFILHKAGVTGPEIDECITWAFGPGAWYVPIYPDWIDRWHKLHPRAFRVKRKDNFVEFIYVVGFMFCMEREKAKLKLKKDEAHLK